MEVEECCEQVQWLGSDEATDCKTGGWVLATRHKGFCMGGITASLCHKPRLS